MISLSEGGLGSDLGDAGSHRSAPETKGCGTECPVTLLDGGTDRRRSELPIQQRVIDCRAYKSI